MYRIVAFLLPLFFVSESVSQIQDTRQILQNPEAIVLTLVPRKLDLNEDPKVLERPYLAGSNIYFRIEARNTFYKPLTLVVFDLYFQNRPELSQDGQLVEYRKGVDELLKAKEKDPFRAMSQGIRLAPDESVVIAYIRLDDWYDELQPGRYQLSVKHRFEPGQPWIESSSLSFEIIPKIRPNSN